MKQIIYFLLAFLPFCGVFSQENSSNKDMNDSVAIVYFIKDITPENVLKLYEKTGVDLKGKLGVKIHFGEDGNRNFLNPILTKPLMEKTGATFVETNVLYVGKRRFTPSHIALAKEHGFTFAPIDILDSEGEIDYSTLGMNLKHFQRVKTGSHFPNYDAYIIYSHFKGHGSAGFGGAIKNLAMGFASPGGKMAQHNSEVPVIANRDKCNGCGNCIKNCPAGALSLVDDKIVIDEEKCIGCAKCIAECPRRVIKPDNTRIETNVFLERLVEYAYVFTQKKPMVFINVLANISSSCDCSARAPLPFTQDIGILASKDIVAIEQASHDLVAKGHNCDDAFLKESGVSGLGQLEYAQKLKMGTRKYKLVEIK
ncbi:MAG: DUF362 domain-containing protein [Bacteroidales bacterium]|jgi:uncharacterized Fe-S center protein|nr:DUF362 domain-containing protein [Bacteroidales bacterium]